jgi:hypothetical protein
MSTKFRTILFVCIAADIFLVVYDRNFTGKNTVENQQNRVEVSQADNAMGMQKAISDVSKNRVKQSVKQPKQVLSVDQIKPLSVDDVFTEVPPLEKRQSTTDLGKSIPLWEKDVSGNFTEDTTIEHEERIKTDPEIIANLQVGQVLEFFVPQLGESFQSEVTSTSNQFGDVKVWKGEIQGEEQDKSNFIMTQGEAMTNVVLSTTEGIYTVYIDNETGQGTVVDEREYTSRMSDTDDAIPYSESH